MKKQFLFVVCICLTILSHAQQVVFLDKVSIDYVKTVAVWPFMKEIEPEWFDRQKDQMPKETLTYYNFTGDRTKSVFRQTKEAEVPKGKWAPTYADNNVIYNDYSTSSTVSQKPCFEETFLVKDSFFNVKWKLTADTRVIAGFECRKAVILGVGIPRLHATWFATSVKVLDAIDPKKITPATKGKTTTRSGMLTLLDKALSQSGEWGQKLALIFML
jgi:GLPGLI family protein